MQKIHGKHLIKKHITNEHGVMFSPNISSKKDNGDYGQFCKYELVKSCPYKSVLRMHMIDKLKISN